MRQIHGPFRLSAGDHTEDVPSIGKDDKQVTIKIKELQPSFVVGDDGVRHPISQGAFLLHGGAPHSVWRGDKRTALTELSPGDEIELCHSVTYGAADTPPNLRKTGVVYEPFVSNRPLDEMFNQPHAMKFWKATDVAQGKEIDELRRQVAELREKLADKAKQVEPSPENQNKPSPQHGKQDKREPALAGR